MSWSFNALIEDKASAHEVLETQAETYFSQLNADSVQEMAEQAAKAVAAADDLLDVIGTEGPWNVSLSGHANPEHGRRGGWANDAVSISISEK